MKTPNIIILGEKEESKLKKPIEFIKGLLSDGTFGRALADKPRYYNYIELIARNYGGSESFDLIFCYDNPSARHDGVLYLGHWNDGVAE